MFTQAANGLQGAVNVGAGFDLNGNTVSTGLSVPGDHHIRVIHHQMDIDREPADPAACGDNEWAHGEVGDKMSIHYVHMQPITAACFHFLDLFAQAGKVCGKDGGGDRDCSGR